MTMYIDGNGKAKTWGSKREIQLEALLEKAKKIINCNAKHEYLKHDKPCSKCGLVKNEWK